MYFKIGEKWNSVHQISESKEGVGREATAAWIQKCLEQSVWYKFVTHKYLKKEEKNYFHEGFKGYKTPPPTENSLLYFLLLGKLLGKKCTMSFKIREKENSVYKILKS